MKIEVEIHPYSPHEGTCLSWEDDFVILVKKEGDEVILQANKAGLISLTNHLLNLAQDDVPVHEHIHLDEENSLEEGSLPIIIEKI